jgi:2-polyprenyl-3-methyl-5-hydroxy-6-metoxy-1,4-benzoquinol methylase
MAITYDDIAEWYDAWVRVTPLADDPIFQATRALIGPVAGLRICDLACGQGWFARVLAAEGADVLGVDQSTKLLAIARRAAEESPGRVDYLRASVSDPEILPNERFDGVLCHMALMDIADLAPALRNVARLLRAGGWFVFSVLHPCFQAPASDEVETAAGWTRTVRGYFDEGYWRSATRPGPPGKIGAYHRTLATYLNAIAETGLLLDRLVEPRFTGVAASRRPIWAEVPAVLIGRLRKDSPPLGALPEGTE